VVSGFRHLVSRLLWGLYIAVFLAGASGRGLCVMPVLQLSQSEASGGHDCCKKGLQAAPPACCMDTVSRGTPALQPLKYVVMAALTITPADAASGCLVCAPVDARSTVMSPSGQSPPLVLRI
jgi:hypothetical protein